MHGFEDYLTREQTAEVLNVKPSIVDSWRWHGKGPAYVRFGKVVRYSRAAIQQFIEANVYTSIESQMSARKLGISPSREVAKLKETANQRKSRLQGQRDRGDRIRRDLQAKRDVASKKTGKTPNESTLVIDAQD